MSVDEAAADPAQHYDKVTEAWAYLLGDNLHYGYFDHGDESLESATDRLTERMAEGCLPEPGHRVIDIGCGTGEPARFLAANYGCHVTGISPSAVCIEQAALQSADHPARDKLSFEIADAMNMTYPDSSFDRVWVMESSHLMPDKARLMAESARLLKPGGRLVLCDVMLKQHMAIQDVIKYRDEFLLLHDVFGRARMETLSFYVEQCEQHGLRVDLAEDITKATRPTFQRWLSNALSRRQEVLEHLAEGDWQKFHDACTVLESFWDSDVLGYGLLHARLPGS